VGNPVSQANTKRTAQGTQINLLPRSNGNQRISGAKTTTVEQFPGRANRASVNQHAIHLAENSMPDLREGIAE
jgi:hypothetical protein